MRTSRLIMTAVAVVALAACGTKKPREEVRADCTFPENPSEKAPLWVCPPYAVEGVKDTGFGTHQKSGAGYQFSLDQAAAKARASLATQMKVRVSQLIKDYAGTTGAGATETVDRAAESVTRQFTSETVAGSKIMRSSVDAKGNVYVVVGLDADAARRQVEGAMQTSMRNQPALWQQFRASQGQAELAAEIYKMGDKR